MKNVAIAVMEPILCFTDRKCNDYAEKFQSRMSTNIGLEPITIHCEFNKLEQRNFYSELIHLDI